LRKFFPNGKLSNAESWLCASQSWLSHSPTSHPFQPDARKARFRLAKAGFGPQAANPQRACRLRVPSPAQRVRDSPWLRNISKKKQRTLPRQNAGPMRQNVVRRNGAHFASS